MGYDLHITRKEIWSDPEGPELSLPEWLAFAQSSDEVKPDTENSGRENWLLSKHPKRAPLWWSRGELYTKNPDPQTVTILVRIAELLQSTVMGDDDEIYGTDPIDPCVPFRR